MNFTSLIQEKKKEIVTRWISGLFPDEFSVVKNKIWTAPSATNPLVFSARTELESVIDWLAADGRGAEPPLPETVIKLQAVSGKPAGQSMAFVTDLRTIIADLVTSQGEGLDKKPLLELIKDHLSAQKKIDQLANNSYDAYCENRELVFKLKLKEIESGVFAGEQPGASCPSAGFNPQTQKTPVTG